jgi:hypothetical protein
MTFDIVTTQYALSKYPTVREGNVLMAGIISSFWLFLAVKAFGVMFIAGLYRKINAQSAIAGKIGQSAIIMLMLLVVGNNLIIIGSATTTYGVYTPNTLDFPGRAEADGSLSYAFIIANGTRIEEWGTTGSTSSTPWDDGFTNAINTRMTGTTFVYAVQDWAHPYRIFGVASNKDVFYTDSITSVNWSLGYFDSGFGGCSIGGNCNDLHKIGTITTLNKHVSGLVDSNGDLYLADGLSIDNFIRASDYSKTTVLTLTSNVDFEPSHCQVGGGSCIVTDVISDIKLGNNGDIHILTTGNEYTSGANNIYMNPLISHIVYGGISHTKKYNITLESNLVSFGTGGGSFSYVRNASMLIPSIQNNSSTDIVIATLDIQRSAPVHLYTVNASNISTPICPTGCASITGMDGLQILGHFAYIASSAENKVYRFPTTISVISGGGYTGSTTGTTGSSELTYTTKTLAFRNLAYYNYSTMILDYNIQIPTGIGSGQPADSHDYTWVINLIDPNGVSVSHTQLSTYSVGFFDPSVSLHGSLQYPAPSNKWIDGSWTARLYEANVDTGTTTLLTISAPTIVNSSLNSSGIIQPPTGTIDSPESAAAISQFDLYVSMLGYGINPVSKMLFSLIVITIMGVIALIWSKRGDVAMLIMFAPYAFLTYIEYIPKWIFIIVIIMLAIMSKVFR